MWTICALYSSSLDVRPTKHEDVAGWRVGPQFRALMVACASAYLSHWVYNLLSCINIPVLNTCDCFVFWLVPSIDLRDYFLPHHIFPLVCSFLLLFCCCRNLLLKLCIFICLLIYLQFVPSFFTLSFSLFFFLFSSSLPFLRVAPIINISYCNLTLENLRLLIMEALFHKNESFLLSGMHAVRVHVLRSSPWGSGRKCW